MYSQGVGLIHAAKRVVDAVSGRVASTKDDIEGAHRFEGHVVNIQPFMFDMAIFFFRAN